jgi:hypothetical protein
MRAGAVAMRATPPLSMMLFEAARVEAIEPAYDAEQAFDAPLASRESRRDLRQHFDSAAVPSKPLTGRLVHCQGRKLVLEISLDLPLDWQPSRVKVIWRDGPELAAEIDDRLTTRSGRLTRGLHIRLVLHLEADGPPGAPEAVVVTGDGAPQTVILVAR